MPLMVTAFFWFQPHSPASKYRRHRKKKHIGSEGGHSGCVSSMGEEGRSFFHYFSRNMSNIFGMSNLPHVSHVLCDADLAITILVNSGARMIK
jgi:hypothetical protein